MFTAGPWLWGLTSPDSIALLLFMRMESLPEDPLFLSRVPVCMSDPGASKSPKCYYTSVDHSDYKGAWVYTKAILQSLENVGLIPIAP